ncbi:ZIP family metal transporter [Engelhardtia mirabilis]|uniref:Zinc transporter ZupT n=1 Tax=Engelhardtia mirabilis TaxID=2528011 RepID=A0A518BPZ6_9BACT|nr:Zinc transporter ZupT [Planctomycetes bacterium Pla133]QDV03366.1 Zinc transporter ZupT [Planctomycetes bacterium Pla86]
MTDPTLHPIALGFLGSLAAGSATGLGALGVFAVKDISERLRSLLLGSAAGVMLAATVFSLILPGLEAGGELYGSEPAAVATVSAGILAGAVVIWWLNRVAPHEHFVVGREGHSRRELSRIWLFVIAIAIHNLPEGMAVGVGYGGGEMADGNALAFGIGLQNIPEGLAVAVSLASVGYSRLAAFGWSLLTGLLEPLGGLVGAAGVALAEPALPFGLGFAGGAMLFVISDEIIPETHRRGDEDHATFALVGGFLVMMAMDVLLG